MDSPAATLKARNSTTVGNSWAMRAALRRTREHSIHEGDAGDRAGANSDNGYGDHGQRLAAGDDSERRARGSTDEGAKELPGAVAAHRRGRSGLPQARTDGRLAAEDGLEKARTPLGKRREQRAEHGQRVGAPRGDKLGRDRADVDEVGREALVEPRAADAWHGAREQPQPEA